MFNSDLDPLTATITRAHGPLLEFSVASRRPIKNKSAWRGQAGAACQTN
jgi:hypothetical protein